MLYIITVPGPKVYLCLFGCMSLLSMTRLILLSNSLTWKCIFTICDWRHHVSSHCAQISWSWYALTGLCTMPHARSVTSSGRWSTDIVIWTTDNYQVMRQVLDDLISCIPPRKVVPCMLLGDDFLHMYQQLWELHTSIPLSLACLQMYRECQSWLFYHLKLLVAMTWIQPVDNILGLRFRFHNSRGHHLTHARR